MRQKFLGLAASAALCLVGTSALAAPLTTVRVANGLARPVFVTAAPGDTSRVFIVEQRQGSTGRVRILDVATGNILPTPFLSQTVSTGSEQGLLGFAFDPDFDTNGYVYISYTRNFGGNNSFVDRYTVSATDPNVVDPASRLPIIRYNQTNSNHNGGWIGFSPLDDYLYIPTGDGGGSGDPSDDAQDLTQLLGKLLRIDVTGDDFPADPDQNYAIPADNPNLGFTARDEIFSFGLRNPYRCDFDDATGDLYMGDVGQFDIEEVSVLPAGSPGGENFGWRCWEGTQFFTSSTFGCPSLVDTDQPIHEYDHGVGCSITGGVIYRGTAIPALDGLYFFSDFCSARLWTINPDGTSNVTPTLVDRTAELAPGGGLSIANVSSFGEDANGEVYICDLFGGEVFKIINDCGIADVTTESTSNGIPDGLVTLSDFSQYLNLWAAMDPDADITLTGACNPGTGGDGVDLSDFSCYLSEWSLGCP
ncbi:MAG: PQQ-dependent sugar dehydrogenase [Planctomycetota bacterium]